MHLTFSSNCKIWFNLSILRNLNVWLDVPELSLESRDNFLSCHCLLKKNKLLIRMTLIDFRTAILLKTSQQTCLTKTYESARSYRVIQGQFFSYKLSLFLFRVYLLKKVSVFTIFLIFKFKFNINPQSFFQLKQNLAEIASFFKSHLKQQFDVQFWFKWLKK